MRVRLQVLTPMRKGPAGVQNLNTRLQALLNPPEKSRGEIRVSSAADSPLTLRVGDRVIQVGYVVPHLLQFLNLKPTARCHSRSALTGLSGWAFLPCTAVLGSGLGWPSVQADPETCTDRPALPSAVSEQL